MKSNYQYFFIAAFIGLLLLPLSTAPPDPTSIGEGFYGRDQLITLVANLRILLGDRVFPKVLVGDHGWLVYTAESDLEDYQKAERFAPDQLVQFQRGLDALSARYAARGIRLVVVIVPNKNTIYPERVPPQIALIGDQSRLEQLTAYLRANGKTQLLDLRPALMAAREQGEIYYATDTHWNDLGAYIAYRAILSELEKSYPSLKPHPQSSFEVLTGPPELLDLSRNVGSSWFPESRVRLVPRFDLRTSYKDVPVGERKMMFSSNPDSSLPSLVLYHDSFFFRVIPLLGEHFRSGIFVQNYIAGGLWNLSWVDRSHPDVVIIEFSERYLKDLPLLISPR